MGRKPIRSRRLFLFMLVLTVSVNTYSQVETYIGYDLSDSEVIPISKKNIFEQGMVHVIPSSHQDIGWENTPAWCIQYRDEQVISPALDLLRTIPEYHYSVEVALSLYEYLERNPEKKEEIIEFIRQGRLEWGATFNQPYEGLYTGEALVRQLYLGKRYLEKELPGCVFDVAWNPDVPSRVMQMPQILAKSGVKGLVFSRYEPGIYKLESPDGSFITGFSPGQYFHSDWVLKRTLGHKINVSHQIASTEKLHENMELILSHAQPHYIQGNLNPHLAIISSRDLQEPIDFTGLFTNWNKQAAEFKMPGIRYFTFNSFVNDVVSENSTPRILQGDWPNTWLYIHGPTHHITVTKGRAAHRLLPDAEKLALICHLLQTDYEYPDKKFRNAWFNAIYPDHGWGGNNGAVTDSVFDAKFTAAKSQAGEIMHETLQELYSVVQFRNNGIPLLVFNPSGFKRTSLATCDVNFHGYASKVNDKSMNFQLTDAAGNNIPFQVMVGSEYKEGYRIQFLAENVPAVGYKTYYLQETEKTNTKHLAIKPENNFYLLKFSNGGLKEIVDKQLGMNILNTSKFLGGELFTMHSEGNGAGEFINVQQPDMQGFETSSVTDASWNCVENGPVRTTWETLALMNHNKLRMRVSLYHKVKRIDFEYDIQAFDGTRSREFRCAFPVGLEETKIKYHTPMAISVVGKTELDGAAGRAHSRLYYGEELKNIHPREVLNWFAAVNDDEAILISSDVSVFDWIDPTDNPTDYPVLQPVLLASRVSCNGRGNWYLQPGDHHYRFSLTSGKSGNMDLMKSELERNRELYAYADIQSIIPGENEIIPEEMSFFEVDEPGVLLTTIKKAEDDASTILRLFDYTGKTHEIELKSYFKYEKHYATDMIEKNSKEINAGKITLNPYSIETYKLK